MNKLLSYRVRGNADIFKLWAITFIATGVPYFIFAKYFPLNFLAFLLYIPYLYILIKSKRERDNKNG